MTGASVHFQGLQMQRMGPNLEALRLSTNSDISSTVVVTVSQLSSSPKLLRFLFAFLYGGSCLYSLQSSLLKEK